MKATLRVEAHVWQSSHSDVLIALGKALQFKPSHMSQHRLGYMQITGSSDKIKIKSKDIDPHYWLTVSRDASNKLLVRLTPVHNTIYLADA